MKIAVIILSILVIVGGFVFYCYWNVMNGNWFN